jgi:hypothetical protein
LIDVILIWSFPDGPPAFLQALNVIVWASFPVVYVARLVWPVGKAMFVRIPSWTSSWSCCRCCGSCASSCSCVAAAFVSTEEIGSIVSIVIAVGFASAFFNGLGMLFLLAGYEVELKELTGRGGRRAMVTWLICVGRAG